MSRALSELLQRVGGRARPVLGMTLEPAAALDLTAGNPTLASLDLADAAAFSAWVDAVLARAGTSVGIGRWGEDRTIYRISPLFTGEAEARSVHLGIDLFAPAGTTVHAPLDATVHSLGNNARPGDYGPTVILEHELDGTRFWTLYGHLAPIDTASLPPGRRLAAGDAFSALGTWPGNGGWPPHLHFQVIADIGTHRGDFPGVAVPSEAERWLVLCPDPTPLLGLGEVRVAV